MSKLVNDPRRPGLNSKERQNNIISEFLIDPRLDDHDEQDAQLKQLKLIKTHLEIQNGEVIELSQNDDDDAGAL